MNRLLDFIVAHRHWALFILLEVVALSLFYSDGLYRRGLRMYVDSYVSGYVNEGLNQVYSYISLREQNERLLEEKARLEHDLIALRRSIADTDANSRILETTDSVATYVVARVVNNVSRLGETYYMINRGHADGIMADMAVMSETGVVGSVMEVSDHYSVVIPIINSKLRLSCEVKGKGHQGQLYSQGLHQPSVLGGVPRHAEIVPGDTVLTSGYSYIFPEGMMVGVVESESRGDVSGADAAFGTYRLRLATDFERLRYVYVRIAPPMTEAEALENQMLQMP